MKHRVAAVLLAMALSVLAGGAQAQEAYAAKTVHLRAGPGRDYPVVAILPPGSQLWVQGCVSDYSWCDVVAGSERGWVYAGNIQSYYDSASGYVPLWPYGAWFGIAVYPFVINDYWGRYYYNRPWYPQLHRWGDHRPPARVHPTPPPHPPAKPGYVAPSRQPHGPGRAPQQPHAPGGMPGQPHAPGAVPGQPHGPGAVPGHPRGPGPGQPGAPIGMPRQPHSIGVAPATGHPSGHGAPAAGGGRAPSPSGGAPGWQGSRGR